MTAGIDRRPARTSSAAAVGAGLVAAGALLLGSPAGFLASGVGLALLVAGLLQGSRRAIDYGGLVLFGSVFLGGFVGGTVESLLVALPASVVAWDSAEHAINVGEQLGREAETSRGEVVHVAASALVGALSAVLGYAIFRSAGGGKPLAALVFLLLGAVVLMWALRT